MKRSKAVCDKCDWFAPEISMCYLNISLVTQHVPAACNYRLEHLLMRQQEDGTSVQLCDGISRDKNEPRCNQDD
jgi:hypothetical protein